MKFTEYTERVKIISTSLHYQLSLSTLMAGSIVYGAMSAFSPLHAWLPFRIQNGRFIQFYTGIEKSS